MRELVLHPEGGAVVLGDVHETELTSGAEEDVFLASWDSTGRIRWAVGAGGLDQDAGKEGEGKISSFVFKAATGAFSIKGKGLDPGTVENPVTFRIRILDRAGQPVYDRVATLEIEEKGGGFGS